MIYRGQADAQDGDIMVMINEDDDPTLLVIDL
jgi:hypothetical protein